MTGGFYHPVPPLGLAGVIPIILLRKVSLWINGTLEVDAAPLFNSIAYEVPVDAISYSIATDKIGYQTPSPEIKYPG